jgi:hypothetical protein
MISTPRGMMYRSLVGIGANWRRGINGIQGGA